MGYIRWVGVFQITLPMLELCVALLVVDLMTQIRNSIKMEVDGLYYYTESEIVLRWIKIYPPRLHMFVSNRVNDTQTKSSVENWRHVSSQKNSADLLSRGVFPNEITENMIWFEGPDTCDTKHTQTIVHFTFMAWLLFSLQSRYRKQMSLKLKNYFHEFSLEN